MARAGSGREARRLTPFGSVPGDEALRSAHLDAIAARDAAEEVDHEVLEEINRLQLGRRKGSLKVATIEKRRNHACNHSHVGIVLLADDPMPDLPADLPEVALVGRSNTGKSALLNALCGVKPTHGAASVSSRAGHTSSLNFFELRDGVFASSALMTLVDLPGYGPAVGRTPEMRRAWARATRRYLSTRKQLACAFVLLDASLGLTPDDEAFLGGLDALGTVRYHCVLTKADLLSPRELAISHDLIHAQIAHRPGYAGGDIPITSSRNAAGVGELWERLKAGVELRLHEMSDAERADFIASGGEMDGAGGALDETDEDDEETQNLINRLETYLHKKGVNVERDVYGEHGGGNEATQHTRPARTERVGSAQSAADAGRTPGEQDGEADAEDGRVRRRRKVRRRKARVPLGDAGWS